MFGTLSHGEQAQGLFYLIMVGLSGCVYKQKAVSVPLMEWAFPWASLLVLTLFFSLLSSWTSVCPLRQQCPIVLVPGTDFVEDSFSVDCVEGGIWDNSSALHLLCTLFLLLLYQFHFRSSGIRFWRLGTPDLRWLSSLNLGWCLLQNYWLVLPDSGLFPTHQWWWNHSHSRLKGPFQTSSYTRLYFRKEALCSQSIYSYNHYDWQMFPIFHSCLRLVKSLRVFA